MTPSLSGEKQASDLWEYVPIADYDPPAAPVTYSARKGLAGFKHLLRRREPESDTLLKTKEGLHVLPRWQIERAAPAPDWHDAAEALEIELEEWLGSEEFERPVVVLVGPPHSGHTSILTAWAERQSWPVLDSPTPGQIMADDEAWLSDQGSAGSSWVLPVLEKAYLRHTAGLGLIRRFLERACAGDLGRGMIGCDSWAWAFLDHVWRGRRPVTLTLQAFDQARLAQCFRTIAGSAGGGQLLFRQADNGSHVLSPPDAEGDSTVRSNFLQLLAAHSRGILGIAWAIWRASLRTEPGQVLAGEAEGEAREMSHRTIWIAPWNQLDHPSLPAGAGRNEAFVLHALLLHNGLPLQVVQQLLPLSPSQIVETLFRLEEAGLVAQYDEVWQVTPPGYPAVRQFLHSNGYLVDQF